MGNTCRNEQSAKAIEAGLVRECSAISTTFLAMRKLGLLQFGYQHARGPLTMES